MELLRRHWLPQGLNRLSKTGARSDRGTDYGRVQGPMGALKLPRVRGRSSEGVMPWNERGVLVMCSGLIEIHALGGAGLV